jgi:hypothetical protein
MRYGLHDPSFFLSYAHADRRIAAAIAADLRLFYRSRVWIDEGKLRAGDSIIVKVSEAVQQMDFVIAIVSKNSVNSNWCKKELALAINEGMRDGRVKVLPLRVDDANMPDPLGDVFYLQVDSARPEAIVGSLISHACDHLAEQRWISPIRPSRVGATLSPATKLAARALRLLRADLCSPLDNVPGDAQSALVEDQSVPATVVLFDDAVDDALNERRSGFGAGGLRELGPLAAPWIYALFSHADDRVVWLAFDIIANGRDYDEPVEREFLLDTIDAVVAAGDWGLCESRLRASCKSDREIYMVEFISAYVRQNSRDRDSSAD